MFARHTPLAAQYDGSHHPIHALFPAGEDEIAQAARTDACILFTGPAHVRTLALRIHNESGWRWGFLARQEAEGRMWYRLAPPSAATDAPPDRYLAVRGEALAVDLDAVPFEALETLVLMSDQRPVPGAEPLLLVTPNLVKLGRTIETVAALPLAEWLQKNAEAFHQAFMTVRQRRGKTILHENLSVARVSDLSLKVALEKALGKRILPLGEEFVAFPSEAVAEVKRLVVQMGHVVKEVAHREP